MVLRQQHGRVGDDTSLDVAIRAEQRPRRFERRQVARQIALQKRTRVRADQLQRRQMIQIDASRCRRVGIERSRERAVDIERSRDDESALLEELFPEWLHAKHSRNDTEEGHDFRRGTR